MKDAMSKEAFEKHIRELNQNSDRKLKKEDLVKSLEYSVYGFYPNISAYITGAFKWEDTEEGYEYWLSVRDYLMGKDIYPDEPNSAINSELIPNEAGGDSVNHPSHYTQGNIECIDAIESALTAEQFIGYLRGQIMKYTWRCGHKKDHVEDVKKAIWYANKLIETLEKN